MLTDNTRENRIVQHMGFFFPMDKIDICSPRRLEQMLFDSLMIFCYSVDLAITPIPQTPEHCFSVNITHSYKNSSMDFAKDAYAYLLLCLLQTLPPQTLILLGQQGPLLWKRSLVLSKRDVLCKKVSIQPCLKLPCDNCQEETFSQSFIVFNYVKDKPLGVRLQLIQPG